MDGKNLRFRSRIRSSIVHLDGHLTDPALAHKTASSTAFLMTHADRSDAAWLITNAHCVAPSLTHVDVVSYDGGVPCKLGSFYVAQFKTLPADKQDLATVLVTDPDLVARAFAWNIPEIGREVSTGTRIQSYGYPNDDTEFSALRGPKYAEGVVQKGSIQFSTWGTNFYADGPWGPGRSGSPVFQIHDENCILLGINRGCAEDKLPNGLWVLTGTTRVISVDHIDELTHDSRYPLI
jgi:hypothetical protein